MRLWALLIALALLTPVTAAFVTEQVQDTQTKRVESVTGPDRDGYTVLTSQKFKQTYPEAELIVLTPNGSTACHTDRYSSYYDVDPVPSDPRVIEYGAAKYLSRDDCNDPDICTREVLVRENFHTGESTVMQSQVSPGKHSSRVHDIDRVNDTHIAVADIYADRVFVYDL